MGDERTAYLPQEIYNAFAASDALAIECDTKAFDKQVEEDDKLSEKVSELYVFGKNGKTFGSAADESCGLRSSEGISISGGVINAAGGTVTGENSCSYGVWSADTVSVNGGSLYGTGGTAAPDTELSYSYGIYCVNSLKASAGTVKGQGGKSAEISIGIESRGITVDGAKVYAAGGMTTSSYGSSSGITCVETSGKITVSAGTLEAIGGTATAVNGTSAGIYHNCPLEIAGGRVLVRADEDTTVSYAFNTMMDGNNPVVTASHYRWAIESPDYYNYHSPEDPLPCNAWNDNYYEFICGVYMKPETETESESPKQPETNLPETLPTETETQQPETELPPTQAETLPSETVPTESQTGTEPETEFTPEKTVQELTLAKDQKKTLKVQIPEQLTSAKITYKSSKKSVAKVSSSGRVTALKTGETKITVKADSHVIAVYEVTVTAKVGTTKTISKAKYKVNGAGTVAFITHIM